MTLQQALSVLDAAPEPANTALPSVCPALGAAFVAWRREHHEVLQSGCVQGATSGDLYRAFNAWAEEQGWPTFPQVVRSWGAQMRKLGLTKGRRWLGYREERPFLMDSSSAAFWRTWLKANPRPIICPLYDLHRKARSR